MKQEYLKVGKILGIGLLVLTLFFGMVRLELNAIYVSDSPISLVMDMNGYPVDSLATLQTFITSIGFPTNGKPILFTESEVADKFAYFVVENWDGTRVPYILLLDYDSLTGNVINNGSYIVPQGTGTYKVQKFHPNSNTKMDYLYSDSQSPLSVSNISNSEFETYSADLVLNPNFSVGKDIFGRFYDIYFQNLDNVKSMSLTISANRNDMFGLNLDEANPMMEIWQITGRYALSPETPFFRFDSTKEGWVGKDIRYNFEVQYQMNDDTTFEDDPYIALPTIYDTPILQPTFHLRYDPSNANWYLTTNYGRTYSVKFNRWGYLETMNTVDIDEFYSSTLAMEKDVEYQLFEEPLSRIFSYEIVIMSDDESEVYGRLLFDRDMVVNNDYAIEFDIDYTGKSYDDAVEDVAILNYEGSVDYEEYKDMMDGLITDNDVTVNDGVPDRTFLDDAKAVQLDFDITELAQDVSQLRDMTFGALMLFQFVFMFLPSPFPQLLSVSIWIAIIAIIWKFIRG